MDKNIEIMLESLFLDISDEEVISRATERNGSIEEDYHYHLAGIIKDAIEGQNSFISDHTLGWCLRLNAISNEIKLNAYKVAEYLLKSSEVKL